MCLGFSQMERELDQPEVPPGGAEQGQEATAEPKQPPAPAAAEPSGDQAADEPRPAATSGETEVPATEAEQPPEPPTAMVASEATAEQPPPEGEQPAEQPPLPSEAAAEQPPPEGEQPAELPPAVELQPGYLVVEGALEGLDRYVIRPVPADGDTTRRLRGRSFRAALTGELLLLRVAQRLALTPLLFAGNRFVLAGAAEPNWQETLNDIQREFDLWLFQHLAGELKCFLAGHISEDGRLPFQQLREGLRHARLQPLDGALRVGLRWNGRAFVLPAGPQIGRCAGCAAVTHVRLLGDESLCDACARDSELGERLPAIESGWLAAEGDPELAVPGLALRFSQNGSEHEFRLDAGKWLLFRRLPAADGRPLSFEQLAGQPQVLGYLYVEVDEFNEVLDSLDGDPRRAVQLDHALNAFFGDRLAQLLEAEFPLVYPVFESGSGALLAGAWQALLDLAARLNREFGRQVGHGLTVSAGLALAHPSVDLASAAAQAQEQLQAAIAAGGGRLAALGADIEWSHLPGVLQRAKTLASWVKSRAIGAVWLHRLAELHRASRGPGESWHPALEALVRDSRIKPGQARAWAARLSGAAAESDWRWAEFLARYASLAAAADGKEAKAEAAGEAEPAAVEPAPAAEPEVSAEF